MNTGATRPEQLEAEPHRSDGATRVLSVQYIAPLIRGLSPTDQRIAGKAGQGNAGNETVRFRQGQPEARRANLVRQGRKAEP